MSPLLPGLSLLPGLVSPSTVQNYCLHWSVCCRFIILLLPLSCCYNADAATRLLQRGCCNAAAAAFSAAALDWWTNLLLLDLVAVDNTSAGEVEYRLSSSSLLFAWNLSPEMRICISSPLHRILYREFNLKSLEGQREDSKRMCAPPPLIKNSPSRRRFKFFGTPATPPPPM